MTLNFFPKFPVPIKPDFPDWFDDFEEDYEEKW